MTHPKWAVGLMVAAIIAAPALAQAPQTAARPRAISSMTVEAGTGRVIQLGGPAANLFVADPKVAEARPASATSLFVFGLAVGHTTIAAMDNAGHSVGVYDLLVVPSSAAATLAGSAINRALPAQAIKARPTPDGVEISGHVATPAEAERAATAAQSFLGDKQIVANRLQVGESIQVLLRVRIVEMSRTLTRDLGLNWQNLAGRIGNFATIGLATQFPLNDLTSGATAPVAAFASFRKTSVEAIVDALAQDQLVTILAEPNLTTLSGEPASFLAGGEFPVPVAQQQNSISVDFKQYGISLAFVPTVMAGDRINMHVRPEISQLTDQGAVQLTAGNASIVIPALLVRRADTTVELGSGQSFAIAGLLSDNVTHTGNAVPGLGEIPGIGALFRSDSFKRQESEIVIIVTPFIVHPVGDASALHMPTDGWRPPNDLERILLLRQSGRPTTTAVAHISGDVGFIVQ
jgi:pilus assembly protein CpaC